MNFKLVISSEPKLHGWRKYAYKLGVLDAMESFVSRYPSFNARVESWKEGKMYPLVHVFTKNNKLYACGTQLTGGGTNLGVVDFSSFSYAIEYKLENVIMALSENNATNKKFAFRSTLTTIKVGGYWPSEKLATKKGVHRFEKHNNKYYYDTELVNTVAIPDYMSRTGEVWIGGDPTLPNNPLQGYGLPYKITEVVISVEHDTKFFFPYKDSNNVICWLGVFDDALYYSVQPMTYSIE